MVLEQFVSWVNPSGPSVFDVAADNWVGGGRDCGGYRVRCGGGVGGEQAQRCAKRYPPSYRGSASVIDGRVALVSICCTPQVSCNADVCSSQDGSGCNAPLMYSANFVLSLCRWKGNRFNILTLVGAQGVIRARLDVLNCSQESSGCTASD